MKILGITGGMGSGKSVVSQLLEMMDVPVYDCDREAKRIMDSSPLVREKLSVKFGEKLYEQETLNKPLLASLIFDNSSHLTYVNSVVHPEVYNDFLVWKEKQAGKSWVGIESAILFESGLSKWVDFCVNVSAPLETRIQRVQKRNGLNRESVLNRIHNQITEEERNRLANCIIVNDDVQSVLFQVEKLIRLL
jgi:dephospho-CoA kinase